MNIKQAKDQIRHTVEAYRARDGLGRPLIPVPRQRPVFMMGPPGIGKTAIVAQVASEMGLPLVSYTMTHHTRQSALGLPFIRKRTYGGRVFRVSEYTMSEIVASVYDRMEQTGIQEGILFLDEINCVSETLAPAMLQFLQYKEFGRHRIPSGWIVVAAGNPPEYNRSAREFDMATWDRLKRMDVEPDYEVWRGWAGAEGVHPSILSYLELHQGDFYSLETSVDGKYFVTPRGWTDLSGMIRVLEGRALVDELLTAQYLQDERISRRFAVYYELWLKYREDYDVEGILRGEGAVVQRALQRLEGADFDERISLTGLLLEGLAVSLAPVVEETELLSRAAAVLSEVRKECGDEGDVPQLLERRISEEDAELRRRRDGHMYPEGHRLSEQDEAERLRLIAWLRQLHGALSDNISGEDAIGELRRRFDERRAGLDRAKRTASEQLANAFAFCERMSGEREMLIFVTDLTACPATARFIAHYGSEEYARHSRALNLQERRLDIEQGISRLSVPFKG